jgi:hypothetical protein
MGVIISPARRDFCAASDVAEFVLEEQQKEEEGRWLREEKGKQ